MSNRPYSRYPPSLHALEAFWGKSNVTWFLREQTSDKSCQCKKSWTRLSILDNRKWTTIYLKNDNGKLWVSVIIVTVLDAVATVHFLQASNIDVKLKKIRPFNTYTLCLTIKWSSRFERINSTVITCIGKFYHLFAPWNTTWHCFYPSTLTRVQRWRVSRIRSIREL